MDIDDLQECRMHTFEVRYDNNRIDDQISSLNSLTSSLFIGRLRMILYP